MAGALTVAGLLAIGAAFLAAAYLAYKKDWKWQVGFCLIAAAFFLTMALPGTRAFLRTTAWAAFVTALESTGQGLTRMNETIDTIRVGMEAEQKRREEQQVQLDEVQSRIEAAQTRLDEQTKRLADVDTLFKSFYEAKKTYTLRPEEDEDGSKLVVLGHHSDAVSVYALLPDVPIPETLELQWHVYSQPRNSYLTRSNLVQFRWAQSEGQFRSKPLSFTYVPDPTASPQFQTLERRAGRAWLEGTPLFFLFPKHDDALELAHERKKQETGAEHSSVGADELRAAIEELETGEQSVPQTP